MLRRVDETIQIQISENNTICIQKHRHRIERSAIRLIIHQIAIGVEEIHIVKHARGIASFTNTEIHSINPFDKLTM